MATDVPMDQESVRSTGNPSFCCETIGEPITDHSPHGACPNEFCLVLNPPASTSLCTQSSSELNDKVCTYEEYEAGMHQRCHFMSADELPAFNIQSMSPHSRSLSPIDINDDENGLLTFSMSPCGSSNDPDEDIAEDDDEPSEMYDDTGDDVSHVSVDQINALIGTPPVSGKRLNLETIFEGVFLHTPPRKGRRESLLTRQICKDFVEEQRHHLRARLDLAELENDLIEG